MKLTIEIPDEEIYKIGGKQNRRFLIFIIG